MDFEKIIENQLNKQRPFVLFRKPDTHIVSAWFESDQPKFEGSETFVFAPFFDGKILKIYQQDCDVFEFSNINQYNNKSIVNYSYSDNEKNQFEVLVQKGIDAIQNGDFQKVVLSRSQNLDCSISAFTIFKRLLSQYASAFVSLWYHPISGIWIGATPEKLLEVTDKKFQTMALAGTQAYQNQEEVIWREKEKSEQKWVTDFILNKLEDKTSSIAISEPKTHRAGNLLHIRTDISGVIKAEESLDTLIDLLHPTPAVCGMPKQAARDFILKNEGYDRAYYSGYLGEQSSENADLYVNLRCMSLSENIATLYMGCGITHDSIPALEFEETVNKSRTIAQVLTNN